MPRSGCSALHGVNPNYKKIRISSFAFIQLYQIPNPQYSVPVNCSYMLGLCHWVFVLDN